MGESEIFIIAGKLTGQNYKCMSSTVGHLEEGMRAVFLQDPGKHQNCGHAGSWKMIHKAVTQSDDTAKEERNQECGFHKLQEESAIESTNRVHKQ